MITWFHLLSINDTSTDLLEKLAALYPDGGQGISGYSFRLRSDDDRARAVLDLLEGEGFQAFNPVTGGHDKSYNLRLEREYETGDFDEAVLLQPYPPTNFNACGRPGQFYLSSHVKADIATASGLGIVVSNSLKERFEAEGLIGARFAHIESRRSATVVDPDYWQLTSDVIMPSLSPTMALYDENHIPHNGDPSKIVYMREGWDAPRVLYEPVELHYRKDDLDKMEPFDVATTLEQIGWGAKHIIVSSRFRQFCIKRGLHMVWHVVHTQEGR